VTPSGIADLFGVVLVGGQSRRFGSPKALASFQGKPLWRRAFDALAGLGHGVGAIVNDPDLANAMDVATRPDLRTGCGPLGGIEAGLAWARDIDARGAFVLACDLPLVTADLVRTIGEAWPGRGAAAIESRSPWGVEPLCAAYGVDCLDAVRRALDRKERAVGAVLSDIDVRVVPGSQAPGGDSDALLAGVNRPEDLGRLRGVTPGTAP
jgi:molybdopterin-guanine dinucleotide biosynthesis protein A